MHDPATYVSDWTVGRPMRRETDGFTIFEYACHEGHLAMTGILAGARKEKRDAEPRGDCAASQTFGWPVVLAC